MQLHRHGRGGSWLPGRASACSGSVVLVAKIPPPGGLGPDVADAGGRDLIRRRCRLGLCRWKMDGNKKQRWVVGDLCGPAGLAGAAVRDPAA
jgi:hypothetical protein